MWNDPQTYVTFSFLIALVIILKKFLRPIISFLDTKKEEILKTLNEAKDQYENALLNLNSVRTKHSTLERDIEEIMRHGHLQAEKIVQKYRGDTAKIIEIKNKALEDIQTMMVKQYERQVLCAVADSIRAELENQIKEGNHKDLVERAMVFSLSKLDEIRV